MAKMFPNQISPQTKSPGERKIFESLQLNAPSNWLVIHSLRTTRLADKIESDADFIVFIPQKGILFIEVKDGASIKYENGAWDMGPHDKKRKQGPFEQANTNMYACTKFWAEKNKSLQGIPFHSLVIFTRIPFTAKESISWERWEYIDREQLNSTKKKNGIYDITNLLESTLNKVHETKISKEKPMLSNPEALTDQRSLSLIKTLDPDINISSTPIANSNDSKALVKAYTDQQEEVFNTHKNNPRVFCEGPAGSGKTEIAISKAMQIIQENSGKKIAFLCYNKLLAEYLNHRIDINISENKGLKSRIKVATLQSLMLEITSLDPKNIANDEKVFFNEILPNATINMLDSKHEDYQYDVLIVDEIQDLLSEEYQLVFDKLIKNGLSKGEWIFFGDPDNQSVQYEVTKDSIDEFINENNASRCTLSKNCRNDIQIFDKIKEFYKRYDQSNTTLDHITSVRTRTELSEYQTLIYTEKKEQIEWINDLLKRFLKLYPQDDIVLLTAQPYNNIFSNPENINRLEDHNKVKLIEINSVKDIEKEGIGYTTIRKFKGLEKLVVIITDVEVIDHDLLYVGMSRAIEKLIILGEEKNWKEFNNKITK